MIVHRAIKILSTRALIVYDPAFVFQTHNARCSIYLSQSLFRHIKRVVKQFLYSWILYKIIIYIKNISLYFYYSWPYSCKALFSWYKGKRADVSPDSKRLPSLMATYNTRGATNVLPAFGGELRYWTPVSSLTANYNIFRVKLYAKNFFTVLTLV